jgi:hypothetical protein
LDATASSGDRLEPTRSKNDSVSSDCPSRIVLSDNSRPPLPVVTAGVSTDNQPLSTNQTPANNNNCSDVASETPSGSSSFVVERSSVTEADCGAKDASTRPQCDQSVSVESHPAPTAGDSGKSCETEVGTSGELVERETSSGTGDVATHSDGSQVEQLLEKELACSETDDSLATCESNLLQHISLVQDAVEDRLSLIEKQVAGNVIRLYCVSLLHKHSQRTRDQVRCAETFQKYLRND